MSYVEAFAASRTQDGASVSQDAFWIRSERPTVIAVADGAGAAEQVARRALRRLDQLISDSPDEVESFPSWSGWLRMLDLELQGGPQSTLTSVTICKDRLFGASVGDSRAYLWRRDGGISVLTEGASKFRLGSGNFEPHPIHAPFLRGDIVLIMSDGVWTQLSLNRLAQTVAGFAIGQLADLPERILLDIGRTGASDDMTVVVARMR